MAEHDGGTLASSGLPERITYSELSAKQKEIYNFQKVAGLLAAYGFNCIKLADDWQGADFLAYHKDGTQTLKVQLKSRVTISRIYEGKDLHIAFMIDKSWHLVSHEVLVRLAGVHTPWLKSKSWLEVGAYSSTSANPRLRAALRPFELGPAID